VFVPDPEAAGGQALGVGEEGQRGLDLLHLPSAGVGGEVRGL
jgi:hypothetical protein